MEISQNIQNIMDSKGVTRYRLSKELGVHQTTLKNWFDKCSFTVETIEKIADILQVSVTDFLPDSINIIENGKVNEQAILYQQLLESDYKMKTLAENYKRLNDVGKDKLIDYLDLLLRRNDHTKSDE